MKRPSTCPVPLPQPRLGTRFFRDGHPSIAVLNHYFTKTLKVPLLAANIPRVITSTLCLPFTSSCCWFFVVVVIVVFSSAFKHTKQHSRPEGKSFQGKKLITISESPFIQYSPETTYSQCVSAYFDAEDNRHQTLPYSWDSG